MRPVDAAEHDLAQLAGDVAVVEAPLADALHDVARLDERRGPRIDEQPRARDQRRRHLALIGTAGADRHDVRAAAQPRRPRSTGVGDDVASTTMSAPRTASSAESPASMRAGTRPLISSTNRSRLCALRRPDAHVPQRAHLGVRLEVAARLHAAADDGERRGVGAARCRADTADTAAVRASVM